MLSRERNAFIMLGTKLNSFIFFVFITQMRPIKSKSWSNQEDFHLAQVVNEKIKNQKKIAWNQVAEEMSRKIENFNKIGKQCRERWTNHLNPDVKKNDEWSREQNQILITLHSELGNKWSEISKRIPGRTDNCIKNHFNSLMRTGFRKINDYIRDVKRKQVLVKVFKNQLLDKVLTFCEGKNDDKFQFSIEAKQLAENIKTKFALISFEKDSQNLELKENLFQQICEFKRHCRRKKMKKINEEEESSDDIKQKKQKHNKKDKNLQSNKYSSNLEPIPQVQEKLATQNEQIAQVTQETGKIKSGDAVGLALLKQFSFQNSYPYDFCFANSSVKLEQSQSNFVERSNQLSQSILGSRLLSSFSNFNTQNTTSGLFNFIPAYQQLEQPNVGFLSTVQDLSKHKKDSGQNYRGQLDFSRPLEQFGQIIEMGQIPMGLVFSGAFESPLPPQEPLLGSVPYTSSSNGFNFLSANMGKQEQQLKLKSLRSERQQNQGQLNEENKTKHVAKSLSL